MKSRWQAFGNAKSDSESESELHEDTAPTLSHAERQLHVYNTLREELLKSVEVTLRQNTRGIALMIVIFGYSLQFGPNTVIAIVPGILGYLFIRNTETQVWMMTQARQIVELEQNLSPPDSPFRYEIRRGGLLSTDQIGLLKLRDIPSILRIIMAGVAYVVSVWYVTEVIWLDSPRQIVGITVTSGDLWLAYGILSVAILITVGATWMYRRELQKDALDSLDQ
jgi:hypothetical protein